MASYIIDKVVEKKEACWATILDLENKGYLKINKIDKEDYDITINIKEIENLQSHEEYILECLRNKKKINLNKFEASVITDCETYKFIIRRTSPIASLFIILFSFYFFLPYLLSIFTSFMESNSYDGLSGDFGLRCFMFWLGYTIILFILGCFLTITKRRTKGYTFAVEMMGLKNYIRDYTLLNEKDITDNTLVGKYLPYAIVLGETEKIENKYMIDSLIESKYFE